MNEAITKRDLIEQNVEKVIDKDKALSVAVSSDLGGTGFRNMMEVIESAKMMAMAGPMIPAWLRGNPGGCWGVILQAIEWKFSPLSVAKMSFEVNGNVAYMSQLVHAVIEARAPLQGRMRCDFEGEGGDRVCIVSGLFKGDDEPQVYRSPKIKDINPKNSPLWKNDPDQQLWYFSSRAWCRRFAPDVLLGVYAKDELLDNPALAEISDAAKDVSPDLHARLQGTSREEGHQPGFAESELANVAAGGPTGIKPATTTAAKAEAAPEPKTGRRATKKAERAQQAPKAATEASPKDASTDHAEEKSPIQARAERDQASAPTGKPKMAIEYFGYARNWIANGTDPDELAVRWDAERDMRDELGVTLKNRKELEAFLATHCKDIRDAN